MSTRLSFGVGRVSMVHSAGMVKVTVHESSPFVGFDSTGAVI